MRIFQQIAKILFLFGLCFFIIAGLEGDLHAGIVFFIPFIIGSGLWSFVGFLCFFFSVIVFIFGQIPVKSTYGFKSDDPVLTNSDNFNKDKYSATWKARGIIFFGPIPVLIGYNKKMTIIYVVIILIFLCLFIVSFWNYY